MCDVYEKLSDTCLQCALWIGNKAEMVYDFYDSIFCSNLTFKFKYDEFVLSGLFNISYAAYHFKNVISFDRKTALTWV